METYQTDWKGSDYFESLSSADKTHYIDKLTLKTGERLEDPYAIMDNWEDDLSSIPEVTFPDIYTYLIETPSEYTKESLKAHKSLEAYNFFQCGHVQDVFYNSMSTAKPSAFCAFKTKVLPSQRQGKKQELYDVWVVVHKQDGWVLTGNCTCMAGLGSACSHVASLLFKIEAFVRLELNIIASTSKLCQWNESRKSVSPAPLQSINFSRPKPKKTTPITGRSRKVERNFTTKDVAENVKCKFEELKKIAPEAALFTTLFDETTSSESETDTASENDITSIPEPLTSKFDSNAITYDKSKLNEVCEKALLNYKRECKQIGFDKLAVLTKTQHLNKNWQVHRCGRITASLFHEAFHHQLNVNSTSLIKKIMQYGSGFSNRATRYGQQMEDKARREYEMEMKKRHTNFEVNLTGLHINEQFIEIGASPDGLVCCDCHGKGLVEIKCPYKYREGFLGAETDANFPMECGKIKTSHPYYFQVQGQMLVVDQVYCDLVVWCSTDIIIDRVHRDDVFCKNMLQKLKIFFNTKILPEIVTRSMMPDNDNPNKQYCYCKRPCFEPMIGCDGEKCLSQWFHYICVGIKRAPKGKWFCNECKQKRCKRD